MHCTFRFHRPIVAAIVAATVTGCGDNPTEVRPAASLAFVAQPANAVAGAAIGPQVRVRVLDDGGGTFMGAMTVTVSLTNANGAVLLGTRSVAAASGIATFGDLRIEKAGSGYTLTASAGSLTAVTSDAFSVTHAAPTKLRFVDVPAQAMAGRPIAPPITVEITDQYDNRAASATTGITVGPGSPVGGLVVAGVVNVAAVAGLATFSDIALNRAGSFTLRASAAGLTAATSASIAVDRALLSRFCPTEATANAAFPTFSDAVAATAAGGTIHICDGTHQIETVLLDRALTIMAEHDGMATVANRPGASAFRVGAVRLGTVRFAGLNFDVASPNAIEVADMYDTVIVEASRFRSVGPNAAAITTRPASGPAPAPVIFVRGNTVTGFHQAIMAVGGTVRVLDNRVDGSSLHGILFSVGTKGTIQRNHVTNCGEESCIHVLGGPTGGIEVLDNVIENDIARRTQYGILITGSVLARGNRIAGIGGAGPQVPLNPDNFAFRQVGIHITGPGEGGAAIVEGNEITNALDGVAVFATGSFRPSVRNNRISRVGWAFALGSNVVADFERNDVSDFGAMVSSSMPVGESSFRCNWWGRAIGPWRVGPFTTHVPAAQWQPFSVVPIAGRTEVACDPAAPPPPTRFCPPEFAAGTGWANLGDAVYTTAPGGTVLVCDGTYGTDGAYLDRPVTIAAERPGAATLRIASGVIFTIWGTGGSYAIRNLNFVVDDGVALVIAKNTTDPARTGYELVVVENNRFTMNAPLGRGMYVSRSDVAGAKVIVRGNTFSGGMYGVDANDAGALEILQNTFKDPIAPGTAYFGNAGIGILHGGPHTVRANVMNGCPDHCIYVASTTKADIVDNILESSATRQALVGIRVDGGTVTVTGNTIRGKGPIADPQDFSAYAFSWAGIYTGVYDANAPSSVTLTGNRISHAFTGIQSSGAPTTGSDNTVSLAYWAVGATTAGPTLHRNDFTDYVVAIYISGGPESGFLSCNYWGNAAGPPMPTYAAYFTPFSPVPIAKTDVKCP